MKETLYQGKFLSLVKEGRWEYCERINATGAAIIAAVTPQNKLLLVEQFRIPVKARTIELPAGIIGDEPDASDEAAAARELLEETGYQPAEVRALTTGPASSGLTSETVTLYLATNLKKIHNGGGIAHEQITVHEVPLPEVHNWLVEKSRTNFLIEPKIYAALYFLNQQNQKA
jgi:ADP-ribose pyrophosphatase